MMNEVIQTSLARLQIMKAKALAALRKGENYELRTELNSEYKERRKEAVRRVIANMTVGKDVSGLFTDVLKNMHTDDLEIKKLIYLYLINYAKTQPDLVILAINTFVKDAEDSNPLLRALAIRTMGCLHVQEVLDYLCDPLRKCLADANPYVRKTAVMCVAKVYDLNRAVAEENGFVDAVRGALADSNAMVVANSVSALSEMSAMAGGRGDVWRLDTATVGTLLTAVNECAEWGQIAILEALAEYRPASEREAEGVCERVLARLQHANGSVVLTTVRLLLRYEQYVKRADLLAQFAKKMVPPLITLLASEPEIQYVALRNINLIPQRHPQLLSKEIRAFFCKYNDPIYVKYEKVDVLVRICSGSNVDALLNELKEYAKEVDVDFVRCAVQAIGRLTLRHEAAADKAVDVLVELLQLRADHVVQIAAVVLTRILRRYPRSQFAATVVQALCEHADCIREPDARAALVWALGEYSEHVAGAAGRLSGVADGLVEDDSGVQLALLGAVVKFFLKNPQQGQQLVVRVLKTATEKCANPDVRDRAYIYWRLLSADPAAAKTIALSERPPCRDDVPALPEPLLAELIAELGCVSSVLQKPARQFVYARTDRAGVPRGVAGANDCDDDDDDASAHPAAPGAAAIAADGEPELLIAL
ncbi:beta-adaptin [Coemansia javaensis]|uniref:AP complex subunit beta n=1 Tax=Coemansia javaensis TaxID=2761396 RepID=A0A9W8LHE0_9FUNG|nr:beta-adaptin [Coemansia javaensis]